MIMKRTWGGPNAPHIKTLTLGKNIVIIQRATGNRPPDTKVVDVHLHGHSYNPLFIFIRSRGRHPLTRLQRQKPLSLTVPSAQPGLGKIKSKTSPTKNKLAIILPSPGLFQKPRSSHQEEGQTSWKQETRCWRGQNAFFIFRPWNAFRHLKSVARVGRKRISNDKWPAGREHCCRYIWISTRLHQICNCVSGPRSTSSLRTHLGRSNGWVNVMKNNLLWFHVITGHHADTRTGVYISVAWQADTPSLPISQGKGLMGRLYCGAHSRWCLLPASPSDHPL